MEPGDDPVATCSYLWYTKPTYKKGLLQAHTSMKDSSGLGTHSLCKPKKYDDFEERHMASERSYQCLRENLLTSK